MSAAENIMLNSFGVIPHPCLIPFVTSKGSDNSPSSCTRAKKVQVGKDQEKAQSEKDSHSKNRGGKKPN